MKRKKHVFGKIVLVFVAIIVLLFLLAPIIAVVGGSFNEADHFAFPPEKFSFRQYALAFTNKEHLTSLLNSLKVAFFSTIFSVIICVPACLGISQGNPKFVKVMKNIFLAPIFLPAIVWGVGMLLLMGKVGLHGSLPLLVAAHVVLVTPYMIRVVGTSLNEFNYTLEDAAASLGATPAQTFFRVTLPQITPGIIVGAMYSFMVSFSELIITLFIAGSRVTTFPVRVYAEMRTEGLNPMVLAYSTIIIFVVLIVSIIAEKSARWSRFFG